MFSKQVLENEVTGLSARASEWARSFWDIHRSIRDCQEVPQREGDGQSRKEGVINNTHTIVSGKVVENCNNVTIGILYLLRMSMGSFVMVVPLSVSCQVLIFI